MSRKRLVALAGLIAVLALGLWSWQPGGLVSALIDAPPEGGTRLEAVRVWVLGWGALAPIVYLVAVALEVIVAPIPGAILYAPGGAIFGGFIGGTLSLIGNTAGAAIAAWLAATFGADWVASHTQDSTLGRLRDQLRGRGGWLVFLLRLNPFTSSDLVSYAAGLAGVPVRQVALGSLVGLAPQCYVQAYLAESLFTLLPVWAVVAIGIGAVAVVVVLWRVDARRRAPRYRG